MKSKNTLLITALGLFSALQAHAEGPVLPDISDLGTPQECAGPICAGIHPDRGHGEHLAAYYSGYLSQSLAEGQRVEVGVLNNGVYVGSTALGYAGRGAISFQLETTELEEGDLDFYLVDEEGSYDSDFGRNHRFTLKR